MNKRLCLLAGALVLGCCSKPADPLPTGTTTGRPYAQRILDLKGLQNLARVNPMLYRGAQPTEEGFKQLKSMGIRTVISLRSWHSEKKDAEAAGLACVEIPIQADVFGSTPPTDDELKKFFGVVLDPAKQPVYFHCAHGKDRTGTMAAIYRMEVDGWSPDEVIEEMQTFGYHDIYKDLINYVKTYKPRGYAKKP